MSDAATQSRPPSRRTAQSSPIGISTSEGASGNLSEILRMTSNSFIGCVPPKRAPAGADRFPSCLQRSHRIPEGVHLLLGVPGCQAAPLLFGSPRVGVMGGIFEPDLTSRVARK